MSNMIGDNTQTIDYAKEEHDRLAVDYANYAVMVDELRDEASTISIPISVETKGKVTSLIKRVRDLASRINGLRELEKMPHYRRGQGTDQFFFGLIDLLAKRDRKAKDGFGDVLQRALDDLDNRLLLEEQARRRAIAEAAQREADRLAAEEREKARVAEETRLAAERARKPETIAAKEAVADQAQAEAVDAQIGATIAEGKAEDAYVATLARPADLMRTRGDDGTLSTMAREGYAEVVDAAKLDRDELWPFISLDAKEKALRQWARNTGHTKQMTGAAIGFRNKSRVR
jgi:hypothetical protein